jgi:phenylacetic acid degradation operon negative regulatory protein
LDRIVESTERLAGGEDGLVAEAFVVGAAALRHVRADPLLPHELLSHPWPGDELRAAYVDYRKAFQIAARNWFASTAG